METYLNDLGQECIMWIDDNGAMHSMTKEAYDKLIANETKAK